MRTETAFDVDYQARRKAAKALLRQRELHVENRRLNRKAILESLNEELEYIEDLRQIRETSSSH